MDWVKKSWELVLLVITIVILGFAFGAHATTYYVSNTGSDAANGTSTGTPWQTINKVNTSSFSAGDSVLFKKGDLWRETLTTPSSGVSGGVITFGAYGTGDKPIISGGVLKNTSGDYTNETGSATLSDLKPGAGGDDAHYGQNWTGFDSSSSDVTFGDEGGGSYNNSAFVRIPALAVAKNATITASSLTLRSSYTLSGGSLTFRIYAEAADNPTAPTTRTDAIGRSLTTSYVTWTISTFTNGSDYTSPDISSVIQEVVNRTNWVNGNAIVLHLVIQSPPSGVLAKFKSYNSSTTLCPRLSVSYSSGSSNVWYLSSITADPGILTHDGTIGVRRLTKNALASQWDYWWDDPNDRLYVYSTANPTTLATNIEIGARDNVINSNGTNYVKYQDLKLTTNRTYAVSVLWGTLGTIFDRCDFVNNGTYGIQFQNGATGEVTNSTFTDWGVVDGQNYAIQVIGFNTTNSGPVDITGNTFTLTQKTNVTECMPVMADQRGWVRTFSNNTVVGNGYILGSGFCGWRNGQNATDITVENNVISGTGSAGIIIQEPEYYGGTPTVIVRNNKITNADIADVLDTEGLRVRGFTTSTSVTVSYNLINGCADGANSHHGIQIKGADGAKIYNNTVLGCDNGIEAVDLAGDYNTGLDIRNNIVANNRGYGLNLGTSNTITGWGYNLWYNNTSGALNGKTAGTGDVTTNPLFVSGSDFHLQSSSPAKDAGTDVGLTTDIEGNTLSGTPDIGAYEYIPSANNASFSISGLGSSGAKNNFTLTTLRNISFSLTTFGSSGGRSLGTIASQVFVNKNISGSGGLGGINDIIGFSSGVIVVNLPSKGSAGNKGLLQFNVVPTNSRQHIYIDF